MWIISQETSKWTQNSCKIDKGGHFTIIKVSNQQGNIIKSMYNK